MNERDIYNFNAHFRSGELAMSIPFPQIPPCTAENLATCLFYHFKQAAQVLSQQQTCCKQFVSFCNLTGSVDLPLCTLWSSTFPPIHQHPPGFTLLESCLGNLGHTKLC